MTWCEKDGLARRATAAGPAPKPADGTAGLGPTPDGVGVAPLAMAALDAHFAAAVIADDLLGRMLGQALGRVGPAGALRVRDLDRHIRPVAYHVSVVVWISDD